MNSFSRFSGDSKFLINFDSFLSVFGKRFTKKNYLFRLGSREWSFSQDSSFWNLAKIGAFNILTKMFVV